MNKKELESSTPEELIKYILEHPEEEIGILEKLKNNVTTKLKWIKVTNDLKSAKLNPRSASAIRVNTIQNLVGEKEAIFIDTNLVKPNPAQPRKYWHTSKLKELSDSIKEHGLLQPIVVNKEKDGSLILIAGERRLRAHKLANLEKIKAIILEVTPLESRKLALIENIQRADLLPLEEGIGYSDLMKEGNYSIRQLEDIVQKKRNYIHQRVTLANRFNDECKDFIFKNEITNVSKLIKISEATSDSHLLLLDKLKNDELEDSEIEKYTPKEEIILPTEKIEAVRESMGLNENEENVKVTIDQNSSTKVNPEVNDNNETPQNVGLANRNDSLKDKQVLPKEEESNPNNNEESLIQETNAIRIYGNKKTRINISIDIANLTLADKESIKEFVKSL
ncbi:ParB/RepB/Spo0J family partition protein (plasmid) [Aliarcobacter lanthieri]|uniref:ParB/RepB/Spo0J family partition protein n=1 Tax=Aliarcobacter lanthieri TaxID=1355374 RepID=UPI003AAABB36